MIGSIGVSSNSYFGGPYIGSGSNSTRNLFINSTNLSKLTDIYNSSLKKTTLMLGSMKELSKSASQMKNPFNTIWSSGAAKSSDSKVLTASMTGSKNNTSYNVDVKQVATAQTNKSIALDTNAKGGIASGTQGFSITTGDKTVNFSTYISSNDTNKDALGKIASSINNSGSGLSAKVVTENGKSSLSITGQTGASKGFSITGASADALGLNNKTAEAQDAKYSVDGTDYTSSSNNVKIASDKDRYGKETNKVTAELKTVGTATITSTLNADTVTGAVKEFANKYNAAMSSLNSMPNNANVSRIKSSFSVSAYNGSRMSEMGIGFNKDGTMNVDQKKLAAALEKNPDSVKSMITGFARTADNSAYTAMRTDRSSLNTSVVNSYIRNSGMIMNMGM